MLQKLQVVVFYTKNPEGNDDFMMLSPLGIE